MKNAPQRAQVANNQGVWTPHRDLRRSYKEKMG
jgi:hypothetical protein